jgi:Panthothenate synthetase
VFSSHKELLKSIDSDKLLGLVPTMGSLHQGHLSLINRSIVENAQTIITIYVNPTQFNDKNDLNKYPRNLKNDLDKLKHFKNIFIYTPQDKDLYKKVEPKKYDLDDLDKILEGRYRPGHFNGGATIVEKFFRFIQSKQCLFWRERFSANNHNKRQW